MPESLVLSASLEDYLEAIYYLVTENRVARVRDISTRMGVNMSSVTGALRQLSSYNLVHYEPYEVITLTEAGIARAKEQVRRHTIVKNFLLNVLSLDPAVAEDNADRMEHAVDGETLERFVRFAEFVEKCPRGGREWIELFRQFCEREASNEQCERCLRSCLEAIGRRQDGLKPMPENSTDIVPLSGLAPGEKGRVTKVGGQGPIRKKIVEMGMVRGTEVEVEKLAPLGDPMDIKVKGYHLSLRKEEAAGILVEKLPRSPAKGEK
ncbi:MAG: metal-dependent transcriptional regulator [bacterium]|nr:metal-dependent transcriptional regulator [bacterium]